MQFTGNLSTHRDARQVMALPLNPNYTMSKLHQKMMLKSSYYVYLVNEIYTINPI